METDIYSTEVYKAMRLAANEAVKCFQEKDRSDVAPNVGAVIMSNGEILASGFRGEINPGDHAEYTLMEKKLPDSDLTSAWLFTTLEPCTKRNPPKIPCATRIVKRGLERVYIGMLDPNPLILGKGYYELIREGIQVYLFESSIANELIEMNKSFSDRFNGQPQDTGTNVSILQLHRLWNDGISAAYLQLRSTMKDPNVVRNMPSWGLETEMKSVFTFFDQVSVVRRYVTDEELSLFAAVEHNSEPIDMAALVDDAWKLFQPAVLSLREVHSNDILFQEWERRAGKKR